MRGRSVSLVWKIFLPALCAGIVFPVAGWSLTPPETGAVMLHRAPSESALRSLVREVSLEYGLDPRLVDAVIRIESNYNPRAISPKGAMGLMQLMPETALRLKVMDPFDPEQNLRGGVQEFSRLLDRYAGDLDLALAAYNAGEGAVARYRGIPPYRETRFYVVRIMELYTGKSYHLGLAKKPKRPVRLVRDKFSGAITISNVSVSPHSGGSAVSHSPTVSLGGGFGK